MNHVSEILVRKQVPPVVVAPQTTVFEALEIMANRHIGSVIVVENGNYLGLVTERDYSRKVILKNRNSHETPVAEIMSSDLPHIPPTHTTDECMELMTQHNIRYLPVFEQEKLVGIISMSDIVKQIIHVQKQTIAHLNNYIYS